MIGKAASGLIPSRHTRIRHGAYRPIPRVMSAPRTKFTATAKSSRAPARPVASPPPGIQPRLVMRIRAAAAVSAVLMPSWTARRGRRDTSPAPSHAPRTEAAIMLMSVSGSTVTAAMKISASVSVGSACPDVERAGYQLVRHTTKELEDCGRRRESADPEGVKEVGRKAEHHIRTARTARPGCAAASFDREPLPGVPAGDEHERDEQDPGAGNHGANIAAGCSDTERYPPPGERTDR